MINVVIFGCLFVNVEFNNIYVWYCIRFVLRCNWVRLWFLVICENIINIIKNIFFYFFLGKYGEKIGLRKYSMNIINDFIVRLLM